ncbi:mechanosensitive ion channel family protein [Aquibacillus sp. 3ASR75-11]|uniref:Mechanosensitive ion channel family protein n=1 Tax=Terrihalobacillus insolitus TaxID=2950438 RepID=A0A9X3WTJ1_9BACI|nr:mechanosensitive ion channel family protein [Terrihalobacillus insolitus]MDC3425250.1 mechanosensitive ion channel family protein [Terrihalobacillus insolitus]
MNWSKFEIYSQGFFDNTITQILIGAGFVFLIVILFKRIIRSFFEKTSFIEERKEQTIESMLNSLIRYVATFGLIVYVLSVFEVPVGKVLAGAGVIGIILGFGAQSLIKDLLAGIFLLYEKQLHKGDWIKVNNSFQGIVEDVGLRFLKVRKWAGELVTISNGQVQTIENFNIDKMRVIESVTTSFYEDPKKVFQTLEEAVARLNSELDLFLKKDPLGKVIEQYQVYGMSSLNDQFQGYQYTVTGLCNDEIYWTAAKETRRIIAETLYKNNIQMAEQRVEVKQSISRSSSNEI